MNRSKIQMLGGFILKTNDQTIDLVAGSYTHLNRKTLEEGNGIAIVIADQADAILQEISDSLNAAAQ